MTVLGDFACLNGVGQHLDWLKRTFLQCLAANLARDPADMIDMIMHVLEAGLKCKQVAQNAFVLIELDYMPLAGQKFTVKDRLAVSWTL